MLIEEKSGSLFDRVVRCDHRRQVERFAHAIYTSSD